MGKTWTQQASEMATPFVRPVAFMTATAVWPTMVDFLTKVDFLEVLQFVAIGNAAHLDHMRHTPGKGIGLGTVYGLGCYGVTKVVDVVADHFNVDYGSLVNTATGVTITTVIYETLQNYPTLLSYVFPVLAVNKDEDKYKNIDEIIDHGNSMMTEQQITGAFNTLKGDDNYTE